MTRFLNQHYADYPLRHASRLNLILHVLFVPVFLSGGITLMTGLVRLDPWLAVGGFVAMPLAMIPQGIGHKQEAEPPAPFAGPLDVARRIFAEQWITFPRFVLSGELFRAWRKTG